MSRAGTNTTRLVLRIFPRRFAERAGPDREDGRAVHEPAGRRRARGPDPRGQAPVFLHLRERGEPQTVILTPPQTPNQVFQLASDVDQHLAMARVDPNLSDRNHLTVRASYWAAVWPFTIDSNSSHPSGGSRRNLDSRNIIGTWTNVLSNTEVQELKVGFDQFHLLQKMPVPGYQQHAHLFVSRLLYRRGQPISAVRPAVDVQCALRPHKARRQPRYQARRRTPLFLGARRLHRRAARVVFVCLATAHCGTRPPISGGRLRRSDEMGRLRARLTRVELHECHGLRCGQLHSADLRALARRLVARDRPIDAQLRRPMGFRPRRG